MIQFGKMAAVALISTTSMIVPCQTAGQEASSDRIGTVPHIDVSRSTIENLRVCRMVEPSDIVKPVFSWQMRTARQGAAQKAYAIELRTEDGREVWRSGKVNGAESHAVAYTGSALKSATRYRWSVVVSDERGREIVSKPATFATGLVVADDWKGSEWISVPNVTTDVSEEVRRHRCAMPGASCFAKRIKNGKDVKEAWWTVTGQGVFQAYVNGKPLCLRRGIGVDVRYDGRHPARPEIARLAAFHSRPET